MKNFGNSIVMHGNFDPAVFQPTWLLYHGIEDLLPANEVEIFSRGLDIVNYKIKNSTYYIDKSRFQIDDFDHSSKDLINKKLCKLFIEIFPDLQINGINLIRHLHFELQDIKQWQKISNKLAPAKAWKEFGFEMHDRDVTLQDGLSSMKVCKSEMLDNCILNKFTTIERSRLYPISGIFLCVDYYYNFGFEQTASYCMDFALSEIERFVEESDRQFNSIQENGL